MTREILLGLMAAFLGAIWWLNRRGQGASANTAPSLIDRASVAVADTVESATAAVVEWNTPQKGLIYQATFDAATMTYGLPAKLLSRMAYQESRYNPAAVSPVGAVGLMQFMPATAASFGLDPTDPQASIFAAAKYMRQLYDRFQSWPLALAAYNWGPGNVARKGIDQAPAETRDYVAQIGSDVGLL